MGTLLLESVYGIRYSDESIASLTSSPVPEILYYNQPGVLSHFVMLSITCGRGVTGNYHSANFVHTSQRAECLQDSIQIT